MIADRPIVLPLILALSAALTLAPASAKAATCMTPEEASAEQVRQLQTTLMVGALQCRNRHDLAVTTRYNQVVRLHGTVISSYNQKLTHYFQRTHGGGYQAVMDRHVTSMANNISRAAQRDPGFCDQVAAAAGHLLTGNPDIAQFASAAPLIEVDRPALCPMSGVQQAEAP